MKKTRVRWLLVCSMVLLLTIHLPPTLLARPLLVVFVHWEPFGYLQDDRAVGFELDTFRAVAAELGLTVTFAERPWKRCLYMIENRTADVLISALRTPEREAYMIFPAEHISVNNTAFFTTHDSPVVFDGTFESLSGKIIGVTSGFSYGEAFDHADNLIKDGNIKTETILTKLLMGRYDLGIGNIAVITTMAMKQQTLHQIRFLRPLVHSQRLYAVFSRFEGHEVLAQDFSRELRLFKQTHTYLSILRHYGISPENQKLQVLP
jgi:polar amino acid transport system substrate-binding protein